MKMIKIEIEEKTHGMLCVIQDMLKASDGIRYSIDTIVHVSLNNELKRLRRENANCKKTKKTL